MTSKHGYGTCTDCHISHSRLSCDTGMEHTLGVPSQPVVHSVHGLHLEDVGDRLLLVVLELPLGELDIDGDVHGAEEVVVLVVGHPLALLPDPRARPRDLVARHVHLGRVSVMSGVFTAATISMYTVQAYSKSVIVA